MQTHIMLDLETLGTGNHAALLQVAAVPFTVDEGPDEGMAFDMYVDVESPDFGTIEPATVCWWMSQPQPARDRVMGSGGFPLHDVLYSLERWFQCQIPVAGVWACSPSFDTRLIRQARERCGLIPDSITHHRLERCFRTLRHLGVPRPDFEGVQHDALADAVHQAQWAAAILGKLGCS